MTLAAHWIICLIGWLHTHIYFELSVNPIYVIRNWAKIPKLSTLSPKYGIKLGCPMKSFHFSLGPSPRLIDGSNFEIFFELHNWYRYICSIVLYYVWTLDTDICRLFGPSWWRRQRGLTWCAIFFILLGAICVLRTRARYSTLWALDIWRQCNNF